MGRISDPDSTPPFKTCQRCAGSGVIEKNPALVQAAPEHIGKMCEEVMADIRGDSTQIDDVLKNFIDTETKLTQNLIH